MTVASRLLQRALTPQQIFNTDAGWAGPSSAAGIPVTAESAMRLPAFYSGYRLLVSDIASCPVDVVRKDGDRRVPVAKPAWMRHPTTNPNDTWQDHISDVVASYLTDGNQFTYAIPDVVFPEQLYALDPRQCAIVRRGPTVVAYYYQGIEVSPDQMIHKALVRVPGQARGIGPIEAGLDSIGEGLAAQTFSAKWFKDGALLDVVVEVPGSMQDTDIERLRGQMRRRWTGSRNSHAIGVLTGGAKISRIGATASEAQLLELRKFSVQDQARLLGIPSFMIGDVTPGAVSYASAEVSDRRYLRSAVVSIVSRIEDAYQRLLPEDQQYRTNLAALMRGDRQARWQTYQIGINTRVLTVDEVRAWEDLPPADEAAGIETEWGGFVKTPNNSEDAKAPDEPAPADEGPAPDEETDA